MRDHDDGRPEFLRQAVEDPHDGEGALAIERRGGLVGQDDRWLVGQGPGDGHALLLAARQLGNPGLCPVMHVQGRQHLQRRGACHGVLDARQHGKQRHVVGGVEEGDQVRRLEDEADAVAPQRAQIAALPAVVVDHFAGQGEAPGARLDHRAQALEQRALAGTRGANQSHHLAGFDAHVHALQGVHGGLAAAVPLGEVLDQDGRFGRGHDSASDRLGGVDVQGRADREHGRQSADRERESERNHGIVGLQQDVFREHRRPERGGELAHEEANEAQSQRLLHDHRGDGSIARADQLQHGDLFDLAEGHGVDDEGHDGRANDRQNDEKQGDLPGGGGDQLCHQDLFHVGVGVRGQVLPALDVVGHLTRIVSVFHSHQDGVDPVR